MYLTLRHFDSFWNCIEHACGFVVARAWLLGSRLKPGQWRSRPAHPPLHVLSAQGKRCNLAARGGEWTVHQRRRLHVELGSVHGERRVAGVGCGFIELGRRCYESDRGARLHPSSTAETAVSERRAAEVNTGSEETFHLHTFCRSKRTNGSHCNSKDWRLHACEL